MDNRITKLEIMGILLKDILLEIKVRRPGIKFPIKIEDQQDWDTWSKILGMRS